MLLARRERYRTSYAPAIRACAARPARAAGAAWRGEYVDAGHDTDVAVRLGLQRSGRLITSAALLMLIVFGFFAAARVGDLEQIGLGLFAAVLVDATIVRCVLVPATMTLLGRWNWWAPGPLRRLHARFGLAESEAGLGAAVGAGSEALIEPDAGSDTPTPGRTLRRPETVRQSRSRRWRRPEAELEAGVGVPPAGGPAW